MKVKIYVSEFKYYIDELNSFAIPLIIQFVASYLIGLTDQAIIGRISVEAYGVIGVVNSFNYMLLGIVGSVSIIFNSCWIVSGICSESDFRLFVCAWGYGISKVWG